MPAARRRKPAQGVEDRLDKSTDLGSGNGVVADMRRDDLGSEGEKLASFDALAFGHFHSLQIAAAAAGDVEQYSSDARLTSGGICQS